jgi:hypothetical protein
MKISSREPGASKLKLRHPNCDLDEISEILQTMSLPALTILTQGQPGKSHAVVMGFD